MILSKGGRARLDLAMPVETNHQLPTPLAEAKETIYITDAEIRDLEKANMLAALRHTDWRIWGDDGAAKLLDLKPSTLTYRMRVFGIRKED